MLLHYQHTSLLGYFICGPLHPGNSAVSPIELLFVCLPIGRKVKYYTYTEWFDYPILVYSV